MKNSAIKRKLDKNSGKKDKHVGRGQAAMEFLMSYGWAILSAIIALGVLATFGVFDFKSLSSEKLMMNSPFYGIGVVPRVSESTPGALDLEILNNGGEKYIITGVEVKGCGAISGNLELDTSKRSVFTVPCTSNPSFGGLSEGDTLEGYITIKYKSTNSSIPLVETGKYVSRVREGVSSVGSGSGGFISVRLGVSTIPVIIISGLALFLVIRVNLNKTGKQNNREIVK